MFEMHVPPRLLPLKEFPPYTFVAGHWPHPSKSPAGHSVQRTEDGVAPLDLQNWSTHETYLYGLDLFNHGYYWESHEQWEALWHAAGRTGQDASMLKGLIKLAAASIKIRQSRPKGVRSHCDNAAVLFRAFLAKTRTEKWCGLQIAGLLEICALIKASAVETSFDLRREVERVHPCFLKLEHFGD